VDTSAAFEIVKLARFFALNELLGSQHAHHWRNLRLYYNPTTSRLEPIGFDGDAGYPITALAPMIDADFERRAPVGARSALFLRAIFADLAFFEEYVRTLERISEESYLEGLLADLGVETERNLKILQSEFPQATFDPAVFFRNQKYIRTALDPVKAIQAYLVHSSTDLIELQIGNIQALPVEVLGISAGGSPFIDPEQMIVLPGVQVLQPRPVDYRLTQFRLPRGFARTAPRVDDLRVLIRLLGTSRVREIEVFEWPLLSEESVADDLLRRAPNHRSFEFLVTDETTKEILVKPGKWNLDQDLIIPGGYRVIAAEGTELDLTNAAAIVSYSPLDWVGGEEGSILVRSRDGTGQGLVVMKAGTRSILRHVVFDNLSAPSRDNWGLSGAVTFYESPVEMSHVVVRGARSEDALHILRAPFEIERTVFADTAADALDVDFGEGTIVGTRFVNIGNDAVDVSGSFVEMRDIAVSRAGDKGLSAGERSEVEATGVEIQGAGIAVASKDDSIVTLFDLKIADGDIGLAAFCKKPEFGRGEMVVHGLESSNVGRLYLVEKESSLSVDGQSIPGTETGLRDILY
jgi:hypothetical protein